MGQDKNDAKRKTRRNVIINAVKQLILEAGIERITIDLIKQKIKENTPEHSMGKGTIYSVFEHKEGILMGTACAIKHSFLEDLTIHAKRQMHHEDLIHHYIDSCFNQVDDYRIYQELTLHILRHNRLKNTVDVTHIDPPSQLEEQTGIRDVLSQALSQWLNQLRKDTVINPALAPTHSDNEELLVESAARTGHDDAQIVRKALIILGSLIDGCALRQDYMEPNPMFIMSIIQSYLTESR